MGSRKVMKEKECVDKIKMNEGRRVRKRLYMGKVGDHDENSARRKEKNCSREKKNRKREEKTQKI